MELPKLAISIRQPWAWAIIHAGKDIENRDWSTKFRGPVCIHAAKAVPPVKYLMDCSHVAAITKRVKMPPKLGHDFPRGGIIGTAEIVDCVEASDSPWFFGRYGFVLRSVKPIGFIPVKGALGFFDWRKNLPAQGGRQ